MDILDLIPQNEQLIYEPIPKIIEADEVEISTFSTIRQGATTNQLARVISKNAHVDPITGTATMVRGDVIVTINNYSDIVGDMKTSTAQLFDALIVELTESGAKDPEINLSFDKYISKRNLSDRKEARKQVISDLEILRGTAYTSKEYRGKDIKEYTGVNLFEKVMYKNGIITASLGRTFYEMLLGYPIMAYPPLLWRINSKLNPNSYYLLRKISEHKNMNVGKKNENIISVKTLLLSSPNFISYEKVKEEGRAYKRRIIDPFERDMDALSDTLLWHYCHTNNNPLTDEELNNMTYSIFEELLINIIWNSYPDQTKRLKAKNDRIQQAEKKAINKN